MGDKTEATWIGKLAVIPQSSNKSDAVIFDSANQEVIMVIIIIVNYCARLCTECECTKQNRN